MNATITWHDTLSRAYHATRVISPRGILTRELTPYMSTLDMREPIVLSPNRRLGYKFMAAEAAWILSGDNRVSSIVPYSKTMEKFSDDGVTFFGAYGPKVVDQLQYVARTLVKDPMSRQACLAIWRPSPPETKDVPCTCFIQWLVRDGQLDCIDTMRSSDTWLGWPYDVFSFSMVSLALLLRLRKLDPSFKNVQLGQLHLVAGSQHLYERDFEQAKLVLTESWPIPLAHFEVKPANFADEDDLRARLWAMAETKQGVLEEPLWK